MLYTVFPKSQSFGAPVICQLGGGQLSLLVFCGRGLLSWFSGGLCPSGIAPPLRRGWAQCRLLWVALGGTVLRRGFQLDQPGEFGYTLLSSPGAENSHCPLFSELHRKAISHSGLPGFLTNCVHPDCDQVFFMSGTWPSFKTPTSQTPAVEPGQFHPEKEECVSLCFSTCWALLGE